MPCRALISSELDPYWNLAVEEQLLEGTSSDSDPLLFFWRSQPAVIIGKNQNPWRECNLDWMHEHGVVLARRISGGGAVYHDSGNLNYAVFLPRQSYDGDRVFQRTLFALQSLGLAAQRVDRTSLAVDGFKISGHAFCMRRHAVLHHGTLLFDADIESLRQSLRGLCGWRIVTKATASLRVKSGNLSRWRPALTAADLQDALLEAWQCPGSAEIISRGWGGNVLDQRRHELASPEWLFDRTPEFWLCQGSHKGEVESELRLHVKVGHVVEQQGGSGDVRDWTGSRLPPLRQLLK